MTAVDLAFTEPARSRRLAAATLADAGGDAEIRSVCSRALGLAAIASQRLEEAERELRAAIDGAHQAGLSQRAAEARGSIAYLLALTGRSDEALASVELAIPVLAGVPLARVLMLRGLVLSEVGNFDGARTGHHEALHILWDCGGDDVLEADILTNLSTVHLHDRDWAAAEAHLDRAERLYRATGHIGRTAMVAHSRALAAAVRGDVPAALAAFDEATDRYRAAGRGLGTLPIERAETLLSVLVVGEARDAAALAVAQFARERNAVDLVHARLVLARAALLDGAWSQALDQSARARRSASRQRRPGWAALAGYLALRARWDSGSRDVALIQAARRTARALDRAGWIVEAADARLVAARTAVDLGRLVAARRELAGVEPATGEGPVELRTRAWHARALVHLAGGDPSAAQSALLAGLRELDGFRAGLGASELRVHAAGHAGELAATGLQLAMAGGDPVAVFEWSQRWRAGALLLRPVQPERDSGLADGLAELRQLVARLGAALASGGETTQLRARQQAVEAAIRDRSRRSGVGEAAQLSAPPTASDVRARLGGAVLVEYLETEGGLHAIVVSDRVSLHRLADQAEVETGLAGLRHGLRRLAARGGSPRSVIAARVLVEERARRLDDILLRPLAEEIGEGPLVILPTGALHAMPWAALPSCAVRPVSVAPSAALWHRAAGTDSELGGPRVFVAGPGLTHAVPEVSAVSRRYPGARRFTGRNARVAGVGAALDGASLAHIAAHGRFRADNPLLSALDLADGPLTVYDLEGLRHPPRHVILSACDSGLSAVHPGDELLGLAGAVLSMGSRSLIASVVPVPDAEARTLMVRLHRYLRAGVGPAAALAAARTHMDSADPHTRAVAAGFLCFGAG